MTIESMFDLDNLDPGIHRAKDTVKQLERAERVKKGVINLNDRFLLPPFSVLDARQGYWQDRKRQWLALGIRSELGRGECVLYSAPEVAEAGLNYYRNKEKAAQKMGGTPVPVGQGGLADQMANRGKMKGNPAGAEDGGAGLKIDEYRRKGKKADAKTFNISPGYDPKGMRDQGRSRIHGQNALNTPMNYGANKEATASGPAKSINQSLHPYDGQGKKERAYRPESNAELDEATQKALGVYATYGAGSLERTQGGMTGTSVFDPVLCEIAYRWFTPPGGVVLDPFAGGSVRGIVAAKLGRRYRGIDLRAEQIEANYIQWELIQNKGTGAIQTTGPAPVDNADEYEDEEGLDVSLEDLDDGSSVDLPPAPELAEVTPETAPQDLWQSERALYKAAAPGPANNAHRAPKGTPAEDEVKFVKISAASARLEFNGCEPDYIKNVCHASCCDSASSPTGTFITINPREQKAIEARGGKVENGLLQPEPGCKKCPFKNGEHLCNLHFTPDKPFGCIASPFTLNKNDTLIVRNRYKLLKCYKDGNRLPAYKAFKASLELIFGAEQTEQITAHFDNGGDDYEAFMSRENYDMLVSNDDIKRAAHGEPIINRGGKNPAPAPATMREAADNTPDATPVERRGAYYFKREDLYSIAGAQGGKARAIYAIAQGAKGLVSRGEAKSSHLEMVARIAARLKIPARLHTTDGEETSQIAAARLAGAEVIRHNASKSAAPAVLVSKARADAEKRKGDGWREITDGVEHPKAIQLTRQAAQNLPGDVKRVIVPVISGVTLAGVLHGLNDIGLDVPVLGIVCGAFYERALDEYAPVLWRLQCQLVRASNKPAPPAPFAGLMLNAEAEARCIEFMQPGDLLWVNNPAAEVAVEVTTADVITAPLEAEPEPDYTEEELEAALAIEEARTPALTGYDDPPREITPAQVDYLLELDRAKAEQEAAGILPAPVESALTELTEAIAAPVEPVQDTTVIMPPPPKKPPLPAPGTAPAPRKPRKPKPEPTAAKWQDVTPEQITEAYGSAAGSIKRAEELTEALMPVDLTNRVDNESLIEWYAGDSMNVQELAPGAYDGIFSCPPYADLEVYSDDPADLSNMPYEQFIENYRAIIRRSCAMLKNNRFAVWVVGEVRDPKGIYRGFVQDTIKAFQDAGLHYYNEAILVTVVGSLPVRTGKQFDSGRKFGRSHQTVLVFVKGDGKKAAEACGPLKFYNEENALA